MPFLFIILPYNLLRGRAASPLAAEWTHIFVFIKYIFSARHAGRCKHRPLQTIYRFAANIYASPRRGEGTPPYHLFYCWLPTIKCSVGNGPNLSESPQTMHPKKPKYGEHPERSRPFPTNRFSICVHFCKIHTPKRRTTQSLCDVP